MAEEPTLIVTADGMAHFRICQLIGRLKIEVKGLKFRQSTLAIVRDLYGVKSRTKQGALEELLRIYKEHYGRDYGSDQPFARTPES
jgi:hypothetical protein